jgi:hypothetical protein
MFHRIISWITNPFKTKKSEKVEPLISEIESRVFDIKSTYTPLSEEQIKEMRIGLINAVKEFKEKRDFDVLPISRISEEVKEKISDIIKNDIKEQIESNPLTKEVVTDHKVIISESLMKKKKNYKKKSSSNTKKKDSKK